MIKKLEKDELPLTNGQELQALHVIAKQIHARYRSPFTLVVTLPDEKELGKRLSWLLLEDKSLHSLCSIGVFLVENEGKPAVKLLNPPSIHSIKGRRVVVFDVQGNWPVVYSVCRSLQSMNPQSLEVSALYSQGPVPTWANKDYVAFEQDLAVAEETVVS